MIIDKPYQGKGYGEAALLGIMKIAKKKGIKKLTLDVFPNHKAAVSLYKKVGFKKIAIVIKMEKKL